MEKIKLIIEAVADGLDYCQTQTTLEDNEAIDIGKDIFELFKKEGNLINEQNKSDFHDTFLGDIPTEGLEFKSINGFILFSLKKANDNCDVFAVYENQIKDIPHGGSVWMLGKSVNTPACIFIGTLGERGIFVTVKNDGK